MFARRRIWSAPAVVVVVAGLTAMSALPASAATSAARPAVSHIYDSVGSRGTITARAATVANREVVNKTITVMQGRSTLARNKARLRVSPGTYRVTTTVTYKPFTIKTRSTPGTEYVEGEYKTVACVVTTVDYQSTTSGDGYGSGTCADPDRVFPAALGEELFWSDVAHPVGSTVAANEVYFEAFDRAIMVDRPYRVYQPARKNSSTVTVTVRNINTWCSTSPEYEKVRNGMTLGQVRAIFGESGTLDSDGILRWYSFTDCGTGTVDEFDIGFDGGRVASSFKWYYIR